MYYRKSYKWVVVAGILLFTAAARAKDSKLRIHVEPKQAYIFVDGVPFGDSGRSINIAPGNHTIGVYNYGFTAQVREVSVEPGTIMGIDFKLDAVPGTITGPWGRIQIESATRSAVLLTSKTPEYFVGHGDEFNHGGAFLPCCVQQLVVPAGAHLVTIVDKGKELWSGTVNVGANERVIINAASGKQRVKSWHQGGTIGTLPRFKAGKASTTVAVAPVSGNLVAQPAQINCGDSSQLAWTTAETVERAITSGTENMKQSAVSGEVAVKPIETTTYGFQASGPGGERYFQHDSECEHSGARLLTSFTAGNSLSPHRRQGPGTGFLQSDLECLECQYGFDRPSRSSKDERQPFSHGCAQTAK